MLCRIVFFGIFFLASAVVASADPLLLTNGSFGIFRSPNFGTNSGAASGPGVSFSGGFTNFDCGTTGCGPSNQGFLSSWNRANAGNGGTLVIDGVTYNAFVVAFSFDDNTVTGIINVFADRDTPGIPPLFSMDFIGFGFVSEFVNPDSPRTVSTIFTITSVPEPASLVLLGLGVSGVLIKLKRRKPSL